MSGNFIRVQCVDCSNEQIIFDKASTRISCSQCQATLANPAGGKARLVSATIIESLE